MDGGDVDVTLREYRGDLHVLSWTPESGFDARNAKGRRERVFGDSEEGEEEGVKTSGRVIGASWLLRKTIEKYYPRRLVETEAPFEVVFSVSDNPTTLASTPSTRRNCAISIDGRRYIPLGARRRIEACFRPSYRRRWGCLESVSALRWRRDVG